MAKQLSQFSNCTLQEKVTDAQLLNVTVQDVVKGTHCISVQVYQIHQAEELKLFLSICLLRQCNLKQCSVPGIGMGV